MNLINRLSILIVIGNFFSFNAMHGRENNPLDEIRTIMESVCQAISSEDAFLYGTFEENIIDNAIFMLKAINIPFYYPEDIKQSIRTLIQESILKIEDLQIYGINDLESCQNLFSYTQELVQLF